MAIGIIILFMAFFASQVSYAEVVGVASWYGGGEALNEYTANGDVFDPTELTCASWYYPFGTLLKVTNVNTGRSVVVRVNDRGPNKRLNRAIDLTRRAFSCIANLNSGVVKVKIEEIG